VDSEKEREMGKKRVAITARENAIKDEPGRGEDFAQNRERAKSAVAKEPERSKGALSSDPTVTGAASESPSA
jgi:hypothetical protein